MIDCFATWAPIVCVVYLCQNVNFWFYPLAIAVIVNRQVANALIGHEGSHHLIHKNQTVNNLLARYLFHFPALISHTRYKTIHLLHHRFVGEQRDPDLFIYNEFPMTLGNYFKMSFVQYFTLRSLYYFGDYFTDLTRAWFQLFGKKRPIDPKLFKPDFAQYILFWICVSGILTYFSWWQEFLLYWIVPVLVSIPYIQFHTVLEHGGLNPNNPYRTRTIVGSPWLIELLLPNHLNYHLEHHLNTRVPHYRLAAYSNYLLKNNLIHDPEFRTSIRASFRSIFK